MLRFKKFNKSYNGISVLKIEDLNIDPGVYWIKGINGSGKSTLLKSIGGILYFKGDIILNQNISIKRSPVAYRRLVNFAEAEPLFPKFLTGRDMISLFSKAKGSSINQQEYLIESMGIQNYMDQPISNFSSGMLKKLSLMLAFLGKPELILLDEPLITIDTQTLTTLYNWIREQNKDNGVSFMLTSHQDLDIAALPSVKYLVVQSQTVGANGGC
jgi:ABC-2 type transport system ATP-binding protein